VLGRHLVDCQSGLHDWGYHCGTCGLPGECVAAGGRLEEVYSYSLKSLGDGYAGETCAGIAAGRCWDTEQGKWAKLIEPTHHPGDWEPGTSLDWFGSVAQQS
jgi:hypothetical protein